VSELVVILDLLHRNDIVYVDLKPENILIQVCACGRGGPGGVLAPCTDWGADIARCLLARTATGQLPSGMNPMVWACARLLSCSTACMP
jgi:serine/threonine protein kinase